MNKISQNKNRDKKQWLISIAVAAVLVLILAIVLIVIRDQSVKVVSFEKVSQDFVALYDATISSYGMTTSKFTCVNLNMKFSEGSLICDAHLQIEFDPTNNIDIVIDTRLRKSAVFDVISKDDARTVYDIESTRWRVMHKEGALICTIDRITYDREQYQNKYQRTIESNRIVVVGDCTSNSLEAVPKGYNNIMN